MNSGTDPGEAIMPRDEQISQYVLEYALVQQQFLKLTGGVLVSEANPGLALLFESDPNRDEIIEIARQLRALGRLSFSAMRQ